MNRFFKYLLVIVTLNVLISVCLYIKKYWHGQINQHSNLKEDDIKDNRIIAELISADSKGTPNKGTPEKFVPTIKPNQQRFFISVGETGRIGNLMFKHASTLGIAQSNNFTMIIKRKYELHNYFNLSAMRTVSHQPDKAKVLHDKGCCRFDPKLMNIQPRQNVTIHSYLQSFKYFMKISDKIRQEFKFHNSIEATANNFITKVRNSKNNSTLVGIHVRRGDITQKKKIKYGYTTPSITYYTKAMEYFRKKYSDLKFIVCSDDIKWCEKNLNLTNAVISKNNKPVEDLAILSKCDHTIMSTGTFGWWAAFLAYGTTVYYKHWPKLNSTLYKQFKSEDYFMPDWIPMA